mgnify:CR=1 FL=1
MDASPVLKWSEDHVSQNPVNPQDHYCDRGDQEDYAPGFAHNLTAVRPGDFAVLDGYFAQNGHHINVNVFDRETLIDAMEKPERYPQLTVRVSGYAANFIKLTREQQLDVINRTFHAGH